MKGQTKRMGNELDRIFVQKRKMEQYADEFQELRLRLIRYKNMLNEAWIADEVEWMNETIDYLAQQEKKIVEELCRIGQDLLKAYEEFEE